MRERGAMQVQPTGGLGRIPILDVAPVVGGGRWPAKAVVGETVEVSATVFREGHEMLGAAVVLRSPDGMEQPGERMSEVGVGLDRWAARVTPDRMGLWSFRVEAWGDPIAHWWHDAQIKVPRGQDVELMLAEGARLFARAARDVPAKDRRTLARLVRVLSDGDTDALVRLAAAEHPDVADVLGRHPLRDLLTVSDWYPL
ncbi:maltotransferase domain-containing protein, partial [Actinomadura nitritigenes]